MKCRCGNDRFSTYQNCRHTVIVDGRGVFIEDHGIYDSDGPYGPYICTKCGAEYVELPLDAENSHDCEVAAVMLKTMFSGLDKA